MKASGLLKWIVGIILLIILVGIALSNYSAGIYLAVGVAALIVIGSIFYFGGWKGLLIFIGIVGCVAVGFFGLTMYDQRLMGTSASACQEGDVRSTREITGYSAVIEPVDFKVGSFQIAEHLTYEEREETCVSYQWVSKVVQENLETDLTGRTIQSVKSGTFIHEVTIPVRPEGFECCPDSANIEIKNIPFNSFYDAQYADDLKEDEYLGKISVTWRTTRLGEGIRFAYLPSPFNSLRVVVAPLIELSKNDNWVLSGIGFGFSGIVLAVMKDTVTDFLKGKVKQVFKRKTDTPQGLPPNI